MLVAKLFLENIFEAVSAGDFANTEQESNRNTTAV